MNAKRTMISSALLTLVSSSSALAQEANEAVSNSPSESELACVSAAEMISFEQGQRSDQSTVPASRSNTDLALGVSQGADAKDQFLALGIGGEAVFKLDGILVNGAGDDLKVIETSYGDPECSRYPEQVRVFAASNLCRAEWTLLGEGCLDSSFDLGALSHARYIKLVDISDPSYSRTGDGFDVDALSCLATPSSNTLASIESEQSECDCYGGENLVANGSFEDDVVEHQKGWDLFSSKELAGWKVRWQGQSTCRGDDPVKSPVLELHKNIIVESPDGHQYAELDGDCQGPDNLDEDGNPRGRTEEAATVKIIQKIATQPGVTYRISFKAMRRPGTSDLQELVARFSGQRLLRTSELTDTWQQFSFDAVATSAVSRLTFRDQGDADSFGVFLDDIKVFENRCDLCSTAHAAQRVDNESIAAHALWLPGVDGVKFIFKSEGGFVENEQEGTATLAGRVVRHGDETTGFKVLYTFSGKVSPGDATFPPAGSPKLEGIADESESDAWYYYTNTTAVLKGFGDFKGGKIKGTSVGPAFQVGWGGSLKSNSWGASGWQNYKVKKTPAGLNWQKQFQGDINIELGASCTPE